MKAWIAFTNILMKDMRSYYLKPPTSAGIDLPRRLDPDVLSSLLCPVAVRVFCRV